jgi:hypothetical protein
MINLNDIKSFISTLSTEYVLVGGLAIRLYIESRNTEDIDILCSSNSALTLIPNAKLNKDFGNGMYKDIKVDFLLTENKFFNRIFNQYKQVITVEDLELTVVTVEGLILLKCYALPALYQQGNFRRADLYEADLKGLLRISNINEEDIYTELKPFMLQGHLSEVMNLLNEIRYKLGKEK